MSESPLTARENDIEGDITRKIELRILETILDVLLL